MGDNGAARTAEEEHVLATVGVLVDYLRKDYRATLARIASLTAHSEITYDLLYAVLVPRSIVVTECPTTGEPRALKLLSATKLGIGECSAYVLLCESVDATEQGAHPGRSAASASASSGTSRHGRARTTRRRGTAQSSGTSHATVSGSQRSFGRVQSKILIPSFKGTVKIDSLEAFPIQYHHDPEGLKADLIERGKKWASMRGIHHMQYDGTAARTCTGPTGKKVLKYNVRIVVRISLNVTH